MTNRSDPAPVSAVLSSTTCPACAGSRIIDVFKPGALPVSVGVFYKTRAAALAAPRGSITLAWCPDCGFVHNREFNVDGDIFKPGYEVALHHSQTFRTFIRGVASRLIERFELNGKNIVEIGCGDAFFLKTLAALGGNDCIGIDPTVASEGEQAVQNGSVRLIRDYFGPTHQNLDANFICCLSVFEAIPHPAHLLAAAHAMASRAGAPLYFEVFNAWRAFEAEEVWSVHYEQCNYFSLESLHAILTRHGFEVEEAGTCYEGDQYLFVEARSERQPEHQPQQTANANVPEALTAFARSFEEKRDGWNRRLKRYRQEGKRAVVWGTGGKGITFLNALDAGGTIEYVVEINPDKQDKHVPGTGQLIVPPSFLAQYRPDKIIVTNALYRAEMESQARELGVDAEFLVA